MRLQRLFFLIFIGLCILVGVMVIQILYLQTEGSANTSSTLSSIGGKIKHFIFLPRAKLQLFIKNFRRKLKKSETPDGVNRTQIISDMFADMVSTKDYIQYLVFVISAPYKRESRDMLRTRSYMAYNWTDASGKPIHWKHLFVVGQTGDENINKAVREEAKTNPDLLVGDFEDSYKNLVFKTLWLIEWASNRYTFDAMIKCDDDTIVNLSKFDVLMRKQDLTQPFYGGVKFGGMPVFRRGRYEVTKEEWEPDKFAPYCSGGGYVLNNAAIVKLLMAHTSHVQPVFLVEDAFMGCLAYHAQLDVTQLGGPFRAFNPHRFCKENESVLLHYVKGEIQVQFMDNFKSYGQFCDDKWVEDHKKN